MTFDRMLREAEERRIFVQVELYPQNRQYLGFLDKDGKGWLISNLLSFHFSSNEVIDIRFVR